MGLDQWLTRIHNDFTSLRHVDLSYDITKEKYPDLHEVLKKYAHKKEYGGGFSVYYMSEEVAYWRKANAIHQWFVDNVQNGEDDCHEYKVSREDLEELCGICGEILEKTVMAIGQIQNGTEYSNGKWKPIMEEGRKNLNPEIAEELLPTSEGFFFGGTDYDEYYMSQVEYTYNTFKKIIEETDWENYTVYYSASW